MVRAVNELDAYLARKTAELRSADVLLRGLGLNYRQTDVLGRVLRDPGLSTSVADHQARYGVVAQTARTDLTDLARYARVDNVQFRLLKTLFPGAYTCILPASREVPRRVQNDKRKTIGIRVPDHPVMQAVLAEHGEALMGVSLFDSDAYEADIHELPAAVTGQVALIVDVGDLPLRPTTVLDLTEMPPLLLRQGAGDVTGIV